MYRENYLRCKRENNLIQGYRTTIYAKSPFSYGGEHE